MTTVVAQNARRECSSSSFISVWSSCNDSSGNSSNHRHRGARRLPSSYVSLALLCGFCFFFFLSARGAKASPLVIGETQQQQRRQQQEQPSYAASYLRTVMGSGGEAEDTPTPAEAAATSGTKLDENKVSDGDADPQPYLKELIDLESELTEHRQEIEKQSEAFEKLRAATDQKWKRYIAGTAIAGTTFGAISGLSLLAKQLVRQGEAGQDRRGALGTFAGVTGVLTALSLAMAAFGGIRRRLHRKETERLDRHFSVDVKPQYGKRVREAIYRLKKERDETNLEKQRQEVTKLRQELQELKEQQQQQPAQ